MRERGGGSAISELVDANTTQFDTYGSAQENTLITLHKTFNER